MYDTELTSGFDSGLVRSKRIAHVCSKPSSFETRVTPRWAGLLLPLLYIHCFHCLLPTLHCVDAFEQLDDLVGDLLEAEIRNGVGHAVPEEARCFWLGHPLADEVDGLLDDLDSAK